MASMQYFRNALCATYLRSLRRPKSQFMPKGPIVHAIIGISRRERSDNAKDKQSESPVVGYYELLLEQPLHQTTSATKTPPTPPPPDQLPKTDREERLAKARVIFGSRLAGPAERRSEIDRKSTSIAGVLVPPRPAEPDNCCMSGCVNCVWDIYRDDLEEWAAKSAEARVAAQKQEGRGKRRGLKYSEGEQPSAEATSMDDDGGGSETNWSTALASGDEDLFENIPVGIREFMRTEKKLKEKRVREKL